MAGGPRRFYCLKLHKTGKECPNFGFVAAKVLVIFIRLLKFLKQGFMSIGCESKPGFHINVISLNDKNVASSKIY